MASSFAAARWGAAALLATAALVLPARPAAAQAQCTVQGVTYSDIAPPPGYNVVTSPIGTITILVSTGNQNFNHYRGTDGKDLIIGGEGNDFIEGLAGDDILCGKGGDDVLGGDAGDDTLKAGPGNDTPNGGAGNDFLKGGAGKDLLFGGAGNDTLNGGLDGDTCDGGTGADSFNCESVDDVP